MTAEVVHHRIFCTLEICRFTFVSCKRKLYICKYVQYWYNEMDVICTACEHKGSTTFSELKE